MRYILRRRELLADEWRYVGEEPAPSEPLIVPLAQLRSQPLQYRERAGPLGALLGPADPVAEVLEHLPSLALIALQFPNPGDGRAYSQARLLRERFGFSGELRAVGAGVRQDQAFLLARCGFDTLEPPPEVDPEGLCRALARYDVAYQPGSAQFALRRQRFGLTQGGARIVPSRNG